MGLLSLCARVAETAASLPVTVQPPQQPAVQQHQQEDTGDAGEGDVMADVAPGAFVTAVGKQSWATGRPGGSKGEWPGWFCCWGCS